MEGVKNNLVVIFDFDKTIIDCDSDNWVVDEFGMTDLFNRLLPTMPWNSLMDTMMREVHSQGRSIHDVAECLKRAPLIPRIVSAITTAYALGCELRIVSDANMFFIETILKHHGLLHCFSAIITNPSYVDDEGKLRILPYHHFTSSSRVCDLPTCPPNMCKGRVIESIKASTDQGKKQRIIYLGDGNGDYCSSLKLGEQDFVIPRKNYPVWDLICRDLSLIKAKIHEWNNGEELERTLFHLIRTIQLENNGTGDSIDSSVFISAVDCKFQGSAPLMGSHERQFAQALPIHH